MESSNKKTAWIERCFAYTRLAFVSEIFLAFYWICVLIYVSVKDHDEISIGVSFGLHYAGFIALCSLIDVITEKKTNGRENKAPPWFGFRRSKTTPSYVRNVIRRKNEKTSDVYVDVGGVQGRTTASSSQNDTDLFDLGTGDDQAGVDDVAKTVGNYPLAYGVALFVSMISDAFSLVEVCVSNSHGTIEDVTFRLYAALFGIGLVLTVLSIIWSSIFYYNVKKLTSNATTTTMTTT
jgi:hypothetical protein